MKEACEHGKITPWLPTKRADVSRHGYRAAQFEDAIARFLPPEPNIRTLKRGGRRKDVKVFGCSDDWRARCALRRLTVCQLTHKSRGNGSGLRRGCGFASGRLLGATGPRMESYNWKAKPISPCLGAYEAHPKTTLYGVVFQKLNGPLLTSAPQSPRRSEETAYHDKQHIFRTRTASPPLCPAANGGWLPSTNAARADSAASVRHMLTHTTGSRQHLRHCVRSSTTCGRTATTGARKPMQHSDSWPKGRPSDPGGNGSPADATGRSAVAAYC